MAFFLNKEGDLVGPPLDQHISLDFSEFPNPFDEDNLEQRLEWLSKMSACAASDFKESLEMLLKLVESCNPVRLLTHFAFYDLMWPRSVHDSYRPAEQHQVELLQALVLNLPEEKICWDEPSPEKRMEANLLTGKVAHAFMLHRFKPGNVTPIDLVREQMRASTQTIRNPGYSDQIHKNLLNLFSPMDGDLLMHKGVSFSGLIAVCKAFSMRVEGRINEFRSAFKKIIHQSSVQSMFDVFQKETGIDKEIVMAFFQGQKIDDLSVDQLSAGLWNFLEPGHTSIFVATLDELVESYPGSVDRDRLEKAIDCWSLSFGDLCKINVQHLFLDNPIWRKPLIKLGDTYFWPIVNSFESFGVELLEEQMLDNEALKKKYHERRSVFLEDSVVEMVKRQFPDSEIYHNLIWFDPKEGETDVLVLLDRHALIIECKSGRIKPSAKRGGGSLNQEIKKLVQEPTEQGFRFMQLLRSSNSSLVLEDRDGITHEIQRSKIWRITRLNVTLDFFGTFACEYKLLAEAGMLPANSHPAVTMALVDLENVFWMLEDPLRIIHYLHRRCEFEQNSLVMGDEMDWLACYLAGMFDRWPLAKDLKLQLYMASQVLEPYLLRRSLKVSKIVPKIRISPWWKKLLIGCSCVNATDGLRWG